jgi:hypothetical protein
MQYRNYLVSRLQHQKDLRAQGWLNHKNLVSCVGFSQVHSVDKK